MHAREVDTGTYFNRHMETFIGLSLALPCRRKNCLFQGHFTRNCAHSFTGVPCTPVRLSLTFQKSSRTFHFALSEPTGIVQNIEGSVIARDNLKHENVRACLKYSAGFEFLDKRPANQFSRRGQLRKVIMFVPNPRSTGVPSQCSTFAPRRPEFLRNRSKVPKVWWDDNLVDSTQGIKGLGVGRHTSP